MVAKRSHMSIAELEPVSLSTEDTPLTLGALDKYLMAVDKHPRRYDSAYEAGYRAFIENRELLTELFWQRGDSEDPIPAIALQHVKEIDVFLGKVPRTQPTEKKCGRPGVSESLYEQGMGIITSTYDNIAFEITAGWDSLKNLFHPQSNKDRLDDF